MEDNVGTIVISTKVNTKGLEKGLNEVKKKSKQLEDKPVKITYGENPEFAGVAGETWKEVEAGNEKVFREWQNIQNALPTEKYETLVNFQEELNDDTQEQKELLVETNRRIGDMSKNFGEIGNKIGGLTEKIIKWALALIGVRTAISLITRAFSTLSQYNTELANKVENMRLVLAVALEPIIMRIVSWLQTIMAYINYLTSAWFGLDLYARASELTTKKMADDMAGAAGSAKEMRKQLAGFDEMNVLGDNVGSAGGGGAGKIKTPEFDLDPNVKIPEWLKWIKDNGMQVASIIGAIAAALIAVKLAPFIAGIVGATTSMAQFTAGLALIAAGVVLLVSNLVNLILNWDELDTKQKALSIGLAALGAAMIALGVAMAAGFSAATLGIGAVVAAVIGMITWIGVAIAKDKEERDAIADVNYYQNQYNKAKEEANKALDDYAIAVEDAEKKERALDEAQQRTGLSGAELNKQVLEGTLKYKDMTLEQREVWKAYRDNEAAQKNLTEKTQKMNEEVLKSQLAASLADKNYDKYGKTLKKGMEEGTLSSDKMSKQLVSDMKGMDDQAKKTFVEKLPQEIKDAFDWNKYGGKLNTFKRNWEDYLAELDHNIKVQATLEYKMIYGGGTVKGDYRMYRTGALVNLPRLATGAVVNRPGAGVPLANAITGEAGREGIIPLTDTRAMELLGREIGKWISINATIPVSIGNRQIARVMEELGQQRAFAKND